jgi:hypothetical protein
VFANASAEGVPPAMEARGWHSILTPTLTLCAPRVVTQSVHDAPAVGGGVAADQRPVDAAATVKRGRGRQGCVEGAEGQDTIGQPPTKGALLQDAGFWGRGGDARASNPGPLCNTHSIHLNERSVWCWSWDTTQRNAPRLSSAAITVRGGWWQQPQRPLHLFFSFFSASW